MAPDDPGPEDPDGVHGADDGFDDPGFRSPPPPDDRIWRHPSELGGPWPTPTVDEVPPARGVLRLGTGWATAAVAGLLGAVLAVGTLGATGALSVRDTVRETVVRETVAPAISPVAVGGGEGVVDIAAEVSPAVVRIEVRGDVDGSGSGVVFRDDGHVLTNAHVVDDAERIMAVLADGTSLEAELVGLDAVTDIAVVKVERAEPFPTAVLGTAADLRVGQPTVAIGSPLGLVGGSSVTTGVVSALGREVDGQDGPPLLDMIQTDAAIAPGSSGGALLDLRGTVIGITTAIAVSQVGAEGLGFAVPIDLAMRVGAQLIEGGKAVHVWLGIEGRDLDAAEAADAGLLGGAEVTDVLDGSPAAVAELRAGDLVVALDGRPVASMSALVVSLRAQVPGDVVSLTVRRDGEALERSVTLRERPASL